MTSWVISARSFSTWKLTMIFWIDGMLTVLFMRTIASVTSTGERVSKLNRPEDTARHGFHGPRHGLLGLDRLELEGHRV